MKKLTDEELAIAWRLSQIESRGLQFLLPAMKPAGLWVQYYQIWLHQPEEFRNKIKAISSEQTQDAIMKALKAVNES